MDASWFCSSRSNTARAKRRALFHAWLVMAANSSTIPAIGLNNPSCGDPCPAREIDPSARAAGVARPTPSILSIRTDRSMNFGLPRHMNPHGTTPGTSIPRRLNPFDPPMVAPRVHVN